MSSPSATEKALRAFAQLHFYIPTLAKPLVVAVDDKEITISEPKDAVLWLCKLLTQHTGASCCRQSDLKKLVVRWYPTARDNFSNLLKELEDEDSCLKRFLDKDAPGRPAIANEKRDNRTKWVLLTPTGERVLQRVQSKRQKDLSVLLRLLGQKQTGARFKHVIDDLAAIGDSAWLLLLKGTSLRQRGQHRSQHERSRS